MRACVPACAGTRTPSHFYGLKIGHITKARVYNDSRCVCRRTCKFIMTACARARAHARKRVFLFSGITWKRLGVQQQQRYISIHHVRAEVSVAFITAARARARAHARKRVFGHNSLLVSRRAKLLVCMGSAWSRGDFDQVSKRPPPACSTQRGSSYVRHVFVC